MTVSSEQANAISDFMSAVARLRDLGVIKSDRYLGDIGEFLVSQLYGLTLAKSQRQIGHDTEGPTDRVQIKFHNSTKRTNIHLGDPDSYDRVIVVLGPESLLHPRGNHVSAYCFYEFASDDVREKLRTAGGFSCGRSAFKHPQRELRLSVTMKGA